MEERVNKMYEELAKKKLEWVHGDCLIIPSDQYQISLETVASCRYEGVVYPKQIQFIIPCN